MGILPKNQPTTANKTPRNFFIYGATMNGKSYLAGQFPNPLILDTDGNSSSTTIPSIELRNIRGRDGRIQSNIITQLDKIITELQTTQHGFETIILDVIDDIVVMIEQCICDRENVETLGDIPFGKGYAAFKTIFSRLILELKALPLNVIYVSRIMTKTENNIDYELPSLPEKHVNIVNGNCDLMIQCKKVGKNYIRKVTDKRTNYEKENIKDKRILSILETITGVFERSRTTDRQTQEAIVKKIEERQNILNELDKPVENAKSETVTEQKETTQKRQRPVIK